MRRIGVLVGLPEDDSNMMARLIALRQGLAKRRWSENLNIRIDYRYAPAGAKCTGSGERAHRIGAGGNPGPHCDGCGGAAKETSTIPIVFVSLADPTGSGFIASLARPGGNMTGLTTFEASVAGGRGLSLAGGIRQERDDLPLVATK
jgi:putative ABC transport system substrate-binding protein